MVNEYDYIGADPTVFAQREIQFNSFVNKYSAKSDDVLLRYRRYLKPRSFCGGIEYLFGYGALKVQAIDHVIEQRNKL